MKSIVLLLISVFTLAFTAKATAQTGAITSYRLDVYQPGVDPTTGAPFQSNVIPASAVLCGQTPFVAPTVAYNPKSVEWDDPSLTGKACIVDDSTFLLALPILTTGTYTSTLTVINDLALTSPRSAASNPFSIIPPPASATGLKLR